MGIHLAHCPLVFLVTLKSIDGAHIQNAYHAGPQRPVTCDGHQEEQPQYQEGDQIIYGGDTGRRGGLQDESNDKKARAPFGIVGLLAESL
jgi:hypothetical protein